MYTHVQSPMEAEEVLDLLELDFQGVLSFSIWTLGTEFRSSERASDVFIHYSVSSDPTVFIYSGG